MDHTRHQLLNKNFQVNWPEEQSLEQARCWSGPGNPIIGSKGRCSRGGEGLT